MVKLYTTENSPNDQTCVDPIAHEFQSLFQCFLIHFSGESLKTNTHLNERHCHNVKKIK